MTDDLLSTASFKGHLRPPPWDAPHLGYLLGYANWNYFDSTGLQRRMDYVTEVLGSTLVDHYSGRYRCLDGLQVATRRRIFRRNPDNTVNLNQPSITLDIGNVELQYTNKGAWP